MTLRKVVMLAAMNVSIAVNALVATGQGCMGKRNEFEYGGGQSIPLGGVSHYIIAPSSLANMTANPFHALFYLVFILLTGALFSKT
ncbi:hypothetical protein VNO77_02944 [Canavalia gladiata]|uniref:Uncharacterized protein n=1 Tax=Canavalia gladiata TaxID=3824 RepID=A0AAN9MVY1_CANGL